MGQRHQAFAIAKVVAHGATQAKYRCIGAWHHQWCYGRLPLRATRRFLTLLKQKENAALVRYEVDSIHGKFGRYGQAWNVDIEPEPNQGGVYFSGTTFTNDLLYASMGSSHGDNNDGISVIDVTNPFNPHYCFVSPGGIEAEAEVEGWTPLTAEQYARAYYPSGEQQEVVETDVLSVIASLDDTKLMTIGMLAEAWPDEYTVPERAPVADREATPPPSSNIDPVPSLANLALGPAVDAALASGDTSDLDELVWMPDKAVALRTFLQSKSPFPDAGISLLAEIVKQDCQSTEGRIVDLTGLSLNSDQVVKVLSELKDIRSLTLPAVPDVTIDTVRRVLSAHTNIQHLALLNTGVSSNDLGNLIADEPKLFYSIRRLVHPYIFQYNDGDHAKGVRYVSAFTYFSPPGAMCYGPAVASIPLLYPAQVVQALTDALGPSVDPPDVSGPGSSALFPLIALGTDVREAGRRWRERHLSSFPRSCLNAFRGEGWVFFNMTNVDPFSRMSATMRGSYYGFVKFNPLALNPPKGKADEEGDKGDDNASDPPRHLICDFKQFLKVLEDEGRPSPSPEAVEVLDGIFKQLNKKHGVRLITEEEVVSMLSVRELSTQISEMYNCIL
ncbi:hypothetical protein BDZ89DRAFT_1125005 [Hymenopellis radicata]|nr:hypothetical protein BDZ89DRAFT_1125005 [Hymenopellis radicata]